jgi:hypothetical protein
LGPICVTQRCRPDRRDFIADILQRAWVTGLSRCRWRCGCFWGRWLNRLQVVPCGRLFFVRR